MGDEEPLMTVAEVAARLRVSKMTVYRMIHTGQVTSYSFGKKAYRVPASEIKRLLKH